MAFLDSTGVARLVTDLKGKFATLVDGAVAVTQGGTGKTTHTANAVLTGDGTSAVKNVATDDGALYATAANGAARFGTLPVAQGGTAGTTEAAARESLEVPVNAAIAPVESATATANHAIGDHFMLDDKLKTATAAIATGETIDATNSADATVQAQIDTLRDSVSRVHTASDAATFNAGYTGYVNGGYVGLVKSIQCKITPSSKLSKLTRYTVATLSSDFTPKRDSNAVAVTGGVIVYLDINSDGTIMVNPITADVPSGSNIWAKCVYI